MLRKLFLTLLTTSAALFGCTKSEEREAQRAAGGLMPSAIPTYEPEYVSDQSSVKTLPVRKISYEPLDSFRTDGKPSTAKKSDAKKAPTQTARRSVKAPEKTAQAASATGKSPGGSGGFWKRVGIKALMGAGKGKGNQMSPKEGGEDEPAKKKPKSSRPRMGGI
jgi:hypothetical protein